jgi:cyclophilin family peptidyl-prolyl cis-trans isomerase
MPSSRRTRERHLARLAARRAAERRRKRRQRILAGVVGGLVALGGIGSVLLALTGDGTEPNPAASPTGAGPSVSPTAPPSPGSNCGYVASESPTGDKGPLPIPEFTIDTGISYNATIRTSMGTIQVELFDNEAPCTVNSFVYLARGRFYDGLKFHRVVPDFVIQDGDPTGTGTGGPGYSFNDELENELTYVRGTLAMANSGPNTNGSQWFIVATEGGAARLSKDFTIFGKVTDGMEVVVKINEVETRGGTGTDANMPVEDVVIKRIRIKEVAEQT